MALALSSTAGSISPQCTTVVVCQGAVFVAADDDEDGGTEGMWEVAVRWRVGWRERKG